MPRESGDHGRNGRRDRGLRAAQTVTFTILTGIAGGALVGYGLDRLLHTVPWFSIVGVFVGFGAALAVVFFETK
jgi:F0F1-type ATP synthase assembly protein I